MMNAYKEGKDLYATIASGVYKNDYWDNMEHHQDGSPNPEGKKRRSNCKSLLLGIMYGRGAASIAEQIHCTAKEAQQIVDDFYTGFPKVKEWVTKTQTDAKKLGYVEDMWGRRRRLPDIQLEKYVITVPGESTSTFNPLLGSTGEHKAQESPLKKKYTEMLNNARGYREVDSIKKKAWSENVTIKDNGAFISQAERQCVNARVQGGSASMSKIAMAKVYHDAELNNLGFRMLLQVHDELIGECPIENAEAVADRLSYVMKTCVSDVVNVPFKCDADISPCWYWNELTSTLQQKYQDCCTAGISSEEAYKSICNEHSELLPEQLASILLT